MSVVVAKMPSRSVMVASARNGAEAQTILDGGDVDLIISDVNMPQVDGLELVKWVRAHAGDAVPIVVLSSRCDQDSIAAELRTHGVRVLPKPFSPSRLVVEVERLLTPQATG